MTVYKPINRLHMEFLEDEKAREGYINQALELVPALKRKDLIGLGVDENSRALIHHKLEKNPTIGAADIEDMLQTLAIGLAADDHLNVSRLAPQIRGWVREQKDEPSLEALNTMIYREIFKQPLSEPWLGIEPYATYSALDGNGVAE